MKKSVVKEKTVQKIRYEEIVVEPAKRLLSALKNSQATPPQLKTKIRKTATSR